MAWYGGLPKQKKGTSNWKFPVNIGDVGKSLLRTDMLRCAQSDSCVLVDQCVVSCPNRSHDRRPGKYFWSLVQEKSPCHSCVFYICIYIYIYVCFFACLWLFLLALVWIARALSLSAQLHLISLVGWLGSLLSCLPMPTSSWCSVNCRVEPLSLAYPCSLRKLVGEVLCSVPDPRQNWLKGCFMHSFATKQQLQLQCKKSLLAKNHLYRISSLMTDMKPPTSRMNHLLCRSHALRSAWL